MTIWKPPSPARQRSTLPHRSISFMSTIYAAAPPINVAKKRRDTTYDALHAPDRRSANTTQRATDAGVFAEGTAVRMDCRYAIFNANICDALNFSPISIRCFATAPFSYATCADAMPPRAQAGGRWRRISTQALPPGHAAPHHHATRQVGTPVSCAPWRRR